MRMVFTGFLGPIAGFVAGVMLFDHGPGVDPLPVVLAIAGAVAAAVADARIRRGSRCS